MSRYLAGPLLFMNLIMYIIVVGFASWHLNRFIDSQTNSPGPLLFLNLIMYIIVVGFASWYLNRFIDSQTNSPGFGGNGANMLFIIISILAGVVGVASKLAGGIHVRAWKNDSLAAAAAASLVAWAVTVLAFGLACKEIDLGGYRGWRLKVLEALIIILTFTELLYLMVLHAGVVNSRYGPGYRSGP